MMASIPSISSATRRCTPKSGSWSMKWKRRPRIPTVASRPHEREEKTHPRGQSFSRWNLARKWTSLPWTKRRSSKENRGKTSHPVVSSRWSWYSRRHKILDSSSSSLESVPEARLLGEAGLLPPLPGRGRSPASWRSRASSPSSGTREKPGFLEKPGFFPLFRGEGEARLLGEAGLLEQTLTVGQFSSHV